MKTTIRKEKEIKIKEIYVAQRFKDEEDKANLDNLIENLKFHGMIMPSMCGKTTMEITI